MKVNSQLPNDTPTKQLEREEHPFPAIGNATDPSLDVLTGSARPGAAIDALPSHESVVTTGAPNGPQTVVGADDRSSELLCKCGASRHTTDPEICQRGHTWVGNNRSFKHGRYSERDDADVHLPVDNNWSETWQVYRRHLHRAISGLADAVEQRPGRARSFRYIKALIATIQQARAVDAELLQNEADAEVARIVGEAGRALSRILQQRVTDDAMQRAIVADMKALMRRHHVETRLLELPLTESDAVDEVELRRHEAACGYVRRDEAVDFVLADPALREELESRLTSPAPPTMG